MNIDPEMTPRDLEEALITLEHGLSEQEIQIIKDEKNDASLLHHSLGRRIRNDWSLWERGDFFINFCRVFRNLTCLAIPHFIPPSI